jgi:hypothetical protein
MRESIRPVAGAFALLALMGVRCLWPHNTIGREGLGPPPGVPRWNGIDDPHEVTIEDARSRESEFSLERNGFALIKALTEVRDFYSEDEVKQVYYPEVERLLRDTLGASRVFVFDHNVRNAGRPGMAEPSRRVHNDHTVNSAPRRVRDHMGAEAAELLQHRFGIVNVWRPIRGPVLDSPLALCDARDARLFLERITAFCGGAVRLRQTGEHEDADGMAIEAFELHDNLMIVGGIIASGGIIIAETIAQAERYTSLAAFERCVACAAELLRG